MKAGNENASIGVHCDTKGLGEMNPRAVMVHDDGPRHKNDTQKVTIEDAEMSDQLFETLMGEDVPERRAFIEKYAKEVTNLDI